MTPPSEHVAQVPLEDPNRSRFILLAGAPVAHALVWTDDHLINTLCPPFTENVEDQGGVISGTSQGSDQDAIIPSWRSIPLVPTRLQTGDTQPTPKLQLAGGPVGDDETASFLSKASFTSQKQDSDPNAADVEFGSQHNSSEDEFLEHSLFLHDEMPSSQILLTNPSQLGSISFGATESFLSTKSAHTDASGQEVLGVEADAANRRLAGIQITPLIEVPTATKLTALQPQTLTINVLVGIISVPSAPRQVIPRRWRSGPPHSLDLLEPVVGDPSRSGFSLSLWLGLTPPSGGAYDAPPPRGQSVTAAEQLVRTTALSLRRGDVVLLRNLAMATWQGQVFGQSLRRGLTTIEILHRAGGHIGGVFSARDLTAAAASQGVPDNSMLVAVRDVRDWLSTFVPPEDARPSKGPRDKRKYTVAQENSTHTEHGPPDYRTLPPDTPV